MKFITSTIFVVALSLQFTFPANASFGYMFENLLPRAETVFLGHIVAHTDQEVTFAISKLLRGHTDRMQVTFRYSGFDDQRLADVTTECLVISQGDNHYGKPEAIISLGQYVKGQASYRGWIAFPIKTNGDVAFVDLVRTLIQEKPGTVPVILTLDKAKMLIQEIPYKPNLNGNS